MRKTAFLFKRGRKSRLVGNVEFPGEFFYGYVQLAADGFPVEILDEDDFDLARRIGIVWRSISAVAHALTGIHPWAVMRLARRSAITHLNSFAVVVATTNTFGMSLAVLKRAGLLDAHVIFIAMGIADMAAQPLRAWICRQILRSVQTVAISKGETLRLQSLLGPGVPVAYMPFGVDHDFWKPNTLAASEPYVLSIGNDPHRDYATLIASWRTEFPKLTIVTSQNLSVSAVNIEIITGDWRRQLLTDDEIRRLFREALFVVVPLRETAQPSGQSVCLQAMACGKAVILSRISGLWDRDVMLDGVNCVLVEPGSVEALRREIDGLLSAPDRINVIGRNARTSVEDHLNVNVMADALRAILTSPHAAASCL